MRFSIKRVETIKGLLPVYQLVRDGVGRMDLLLDSHPQDRHELVRLLTLLNAFANFRSIPETCFEDITLGKEKIREYEFRSKKFRIYAIKEEDGAIIIFQAEPRYRGLGQEQFTP